MKYFLLILIGFNCFRGIPQEEPTGDKIINGLEEEYFYAFTEATKQLLFSNYNQAINLYLNCLMYNKESTAIFYQLSKILFRMGRVSEAKYFGKKAAYGTMNNKWYWLNLISLYQIDGDVDSAIVFSKNLIERFGNDYDVKMNLGILYESRSDFNLALTLYNEIEKSQGIDIDLVFRKYSIYNYMERRRDALNELEKGRVYYADDIKFSLIMAEHHTRLGEEDSAAFYYKYVLENDGTSSEVLLSYLAFLLRYGKLNELLDKLKEIITNNLVDEEKFYGFFYNKLLKEQSNNFKNDILDSLMITYFAVRGSDLRIKSLYLDYLIKHERYSESSGFSDDLIKNNEEVFKFWYQKIFVEFNLENYNTVTEYGDLAIKRFSNEVMLYYFSGVALQRMNYYERAISYYSNGLNRTNRVDLLVQLNSLIGDCYFEMEKYDKSFEHYEKAYSYDTLNVLIRNNYAFYLSERNLQLDKAEKLSRYTIEVEKENFIYLDTYAWIRFKMGHYKEARRFIKKAIKYGGDNDKEILEHWNVIMNSGISKK